MSAVDRYSDLFSGHDRKHFHARSENILLTHTYLRATNARSKNILDSVSGSENVLLLSCVCLRLTDQLPSSPVRICGQPIALLWSGSFCMFTQLSCVSVSACLSLLWSLSDSKSLALTCASADRLSCLQSGQGRKFFNVNLDK